MTDRTDIIQKILNLRALGERTSSEGEAMNAVAAAERLMRGYRVEEAELAIAEAAGSVTVDIADERVDAPTAGATGRVRHAAQVCVWSLERYCEVEVVLYSRSNSIRIIGDRPDVALFKYLLDMITGHIDRDYAEWRRGQQAVGRGAKRAFQLSMARRISSRLDTLTGERKREQDTALEEATKLLAPAAADELRRAYAAGDIKQLPPSASLVVASAAQVKRQAVQATYDEIFGKQRMSTARGFASRGSGSSAGSAGRAAGDRVPLSRPLGGSNQQRLRA